MNGHFIVSIIDWISDQYKIGNNINQEKTNIMSVNSIAKSSFLEYLFNFLNMYLKTFNVKSINVFKNVMKNII